MHPIEPNRPSPNGNARRHSHPNIRIGTGTALLCLLLMVQATLSGCGTMATTIAMLPIGGPTSVIARPTLPPRLITPWTQEVAQTTTLLGGSTGPVTATCPTGELALGGGWSVPAQGARVLAAKVIGNTWTVSILPLGNHPASTTVTVYVECLGDAPSAVVTQRVSTINLGATPVSTLDSQLGGYSGLCGQNEVLVGSGFDLGATNARLELEANWPRDDAFPGTQWVFSVRNHDTVTHPFTYYIQCLSNVNVSASYPRQDGNPAYASTSTSAVASCPYGASLAGGGFKYTRNSPGNQYLGNSHVLHASSASGWESDVYVMSGYGLYYATSFSVAVCLSFS